MAKKNASYQPPCVECGGRCCHYIAIGVNSPRSKVGLGDIRWFLLHENVSVYMDHNKEWYAEFTTPCRALDKKGRCKEYETRPETCRKYGAAEGDCEYYDTPYIAKFHTLEEFESWMTAKNKKKSES